MLYSVKTEDNVIRTTYLKGKREGTREYKLPCDIDKIPSVYEKNGERFFVENIEDPHRIFIFGAGHVAKALYDLACFLDIQTIVSEDREDFLNANRFPNAMRIITSDFDKTIPELGIRNTDSVVIMTRGHKDDYVVLKSILSLSEMPGYIGMIGSKSKVAYVFNSLIDEGFSKEKLKAVHAPVGLPFDTETPSEIALSIMAEIFTTRHKKGVSVVEEKTKKALSEIKNGIEVIITEKHGSGPREVGTRMVVTKDSVIGTIGGGSLEAHAINDAREMLNNNINVLEKHYSMNNNDASSIGMVCGGDCNLALVKL